VFPSAASSKPAGSKLGHFLGMYRRRLRDLTWRQFARALVPRKFDFFLAQGDRETLAATPPAKTLDPVVVERYDAGHKSGVRIVDENLYGRREAFVVRLNGAIAHRSVLAFDYMRLAQFVDDPHPALAGEAYTEPAFRGRGLQACVFRHMLEYTLSRGLASKLCAEISIGNIASIKGSARAGLPVVARIQGIKFAGLIFRLRITPVSVRQACELALQARAGSR
jgi:GNAT superfamily N-acetyltransferase